MPECTSGAERALLDLDLDIFGRPLLLPLLLLGCVGPGSRSQPSDRDAGDLVATQAPSIQGTLTRVSQDRILVEEEPLDSSGSAKASVRLSKSTSVLRNSGSPASRDDLAVGQKVSVWYSGPVAESYPVQANAAAVRIDGDVQGEAGMEIVGVVRYNELEGGFYTIQSTEGETYNPINLPKDFQQDGLPVVATVRLRDDMMGIHQVGPLVEIIEIRKR
jgi:hypothetical protein